MKQHQSVLNARINADQTTEGHKKFRGQPSHFENGLFPALPSMEQILSGQTRNVWHCTRQVTTPMAPLGATKTNKSPDQQCISPKPNP